MVDVGGTGTGVVIYNHDRPIAFDALPVGSDHITSDLAICMRTTLEGAEEVKRQIGLSTGEESDPEDRKLSVPRLSGAGFNEVSPKNSRNIMEARVSEILEMVLTSVKRLSGGSDLPGGVVLAGGGSLLQGLDLYASKFILGRAETGSPDNAGNDQFKVIRSDFDVNYAAAVGLLKYFTAKNNIPQHIVQPPADLWNKVRGILKGSK